MTFDAYSSPNYYNGRQGFKPDIIVFHQTAGDKLKPVINTFTNPASETSAHFVIDKNGDQYQFVSLDDSAWCNGTSLKPTSNLYYGKADNKIVRSRKTNANFYTYSIEFVHSDSGNITEAQITSVVDIICTKIFPHMVSNDVTPKVDRDHFVGHCDINPATRSNCPGKDFPYKRIMELVTERMSQNERIYRVQVGSFSSKENAEKLAEVLKSKGYQTLVTRVK